MDVVVWLRSLGLGKYEAVFRENDIDDIIGQRRRDVTSLCRDLLPPWPVLGSA
jgi:hypothetical protein